MIDASGENGDAAERGQCTYTERSIHFQADHFDHYIKDLFKETLLTKIYCGNYKYKKCTHPTDSAPNQNVFIFR